MNRPFGYRFRWCRRLVLVASSLFAGCSIVPVVPSPPSTSPVQIPTASIPDPLASPTGASTNTLLKVHVLDVGQGFCILIECPSPDKPILYDCGSSGGAIVEAKANKLLVKSQLAALLTAGGYVNDNVASMQALVVSHSDRDHYNWLPDVAPLQPNPPDPAGGPYFTYDKVLFSGQLTDFTLNQYVETVAGTPGVTQVLPVVGQPYRTSPGSLTNNRWPAETKLSCGGKPNQPVTILSVNVPDPMYLSDPNPKSVVLRIQNGVNSVIIAGDAELSTFNGIFTAYGLINLPNPAKRPPYNGNDSTALNTSLLVAPHHGASTKGSADGTWAYMVNPKSVIFSAGSYKGYFHPRCSTLDAYAPQVGGLVNNKIWRDDMQDEEGECQGVAGCEAFYQSRFSYTARLSALSQPLTLCCGGEQTGWLNQITNGATLSTWVNGSISTTLPATGNPQAACADSSGTGINTASCSFPRNRFANGKLQCQR